ncbi:MAG: extracellular solute-binding protein, partial [Acholeplasmataceae bacterium]
ESVNYPYRDTIETVQYVMSNIQSLALDVKRYTSGGTDKYRDWDIEAYFPEATNDIRSWATLLEQTYEDLLVLSDIDEPAEIANLKVAASRLNKIADDINKLPSRMVQFSDGDSSINQILGNLMENLLRTNMEMERMIIHGDTKIAKPYANIFTRFFEGTKRLVLSFVNNPYSASKRNDEDLTVWVNHPRQYIEIMQALIDQYYDGERKVTLSQMPDQNKLILANASNQAPDLAIGVDHWIPYEFAVRDASLDLRQFSGYEEAVANFTKGAMIPYVFEDGVYGLPETQDFWVTYYRKDILSSIGIDEVPQTWDEIIEILPLLQSYGMNYFVPLAQFSGLKPYVATLPFIYQFGGDLYAADGMSTAINSEETLEGITLMSDLFTLYNLPKYVPNFYNHFRYGLLPIGISNLATYILLETAAVELDGLWGMDLHPGVYDEELDEIVRYSSIGGQSSMIISSTKYPEESWDFLKWWMSTSVQSEFAFLLQSTYGQAYFWNTANMEAFKNVSMPDEYKEIILKQWAYGVEASRIPGAYMVERSVSNAWTSIVFDGTNPRQALDEAVRVSNREIIYKMAEFGYTENGEIIKEYIVPSIYNIDDWLTEVDHD